MKKGINVWSDYDRQGNWTLCVGKKRGKLSLDEIKQAAQEYELDIYIRQFLHTEQRWHDDRIQRFCGAVSGRKP